MEHAPEHVETVEKWNWFADTYWYVPESGIISMAYNGPDNTLRPSRGQTVFRVTGYLNGYFWGSTVVKLGKPQLQTCSIFVGVVTPEGRVFLTFFDPDNEGTVRTKAVGFMEKKYGQWAIVNQMSSESGAGLTVTHWAYMLVANPGDEAWESLPFAGVSVPEFMSGCPDGPDGPRFIEEIEA